MAHTHKLLSRLFVCLSKLLSHFCIQLFFKFSKCLITRGIAALHCFLQCALRFVTTVPHLLRHASLQLLAVSNTGTACVLFPPL